MIRERENEFIDYQFNYEDYVYRCYADNSHEIKWTAPAYYMANSIYNKENGEMGRLKTCNAIVVFKNENTYEDLDKDYVYKVLNAEFKTHQFKRDIDVLYGKVLNNGSIEWGIHVDGENPPF